MLHSSHQSSVSCSTTHAINHQVKRFLISLIHQYVVVDRLDETRGVGGTGMLACALDAVVDIATSVYRLRQLPDAYNH